MRSKFRFESWRQLLACTLLLLLPAAPAAAQPGFRADKFAAIAMEAQSGDVLFARKADAARHPASLTKVMTLYLAFDEIGRGRLRMSDRIVVSRHAAAQPPTKAGLRAGSTLSVEAAIDLIAVKSANDAATALAEHIAGSERAFASRMNRKARKLGMRRTHFTNASGLPNPAQTTTARDLAILGRAFLKYHSKAYAVFGQTRVVFRGRTINGHNRLLSTRGVDGIKTGYTRASGFNLMTSGVRNGRRVVAVVLGGDTAQIRDRYMRRLLHKTFDRLPQDTHVAQVVAGEGDKVELATSPGAEVGGAQKVWWVQVGAFSTPAQAWAHLAQLADRHPAQFGRAPRGVDQPGQLHQARFNVFSEQAARASCALLEREDEPCFWFGAAGGAGAETVQPGMMTLAPPTASPSA